MQLEKYKLLTKKPHTMSLMILSVFASIGAVLMAPALPEIAQYFKVTNASAKLLISLFLIGYAIAQLIYGPIANSYGRKKAYYIGITSATIGSLLSIGSSHFESFKVMLAGRFLEALGMGASFVITYIIINDYYYPKQSRKIISYLMTATAIVPAIAIGIGGFLVEYVNWQSCFYFLLFFGIFLLIVAKNLPETSIILKGRLESKKIIYDYFLAFKNNYLVITALGSSIPSTGIYIFIAEGPFIATNNLHLSPSSYGLFSMIPYIGTLIGALLSIRLSESDIKLEKIIITAYVLQIISVTIMFVLFLLGIITIYSLLIPMLFFMLAGTIILSNLAAVATVELTDKATANAVLMFIVIGMPVIFTLILGNIHTFSALILPVLLASILILFLFFSIIFKIKNFRLSQ